MKSFLKSIARYSVQLATIGLMGASRSRYVASALLIHRRRSCSFSVGLGMHHIPRKCYVRLLSKLTDFESFETLQMRSVAITESERLFDFYKNSATMEKIKQPTLWLSGAAAATFVQDEIDTVLFDCDGVLYRTQDQCPGAKKCIQKLLDQKKNVMFVTNNAGVNRRELRDKLTKILGIELLTVDQMVSASYSAAQYLKQQLLSASENDNPRVHVIGSAGLCEELAHCGFAISGGPSLSEPHEMTREQLAEYSFPEDPIDALVVGHDTAMNFRKLCIADNLLLRNPNALFVATNRDNFDMVGSDNRHIAGNGCTVVALEYSSRRAATNVGKPSRTLFELMRKDHPDSMSDPSRCLFVGDRLDTDICFGSNNGMKSLLVMTGVTTAEKIETLGSGNEEELLPDFIAPFVEILV